MRIREEIRPEAERALPQNQRRLQKILEEFERYENSNGTNITGIGKHSPLAKVAAQLQAQKQAHRQEQQEQEGLRVQGQEQHKGEQQGQQQQQQQERQKPPVPPPPEYQKHKKTAVHETQA